MEPYAGLIEDVRDALLAVPESERSLLELRLTWPALGDREALIAARLRVFLLTWDPFWWMRDRGWHGRPRPETATPTRSSCI